MTTIQTASGREVSLLTPAANDIYWPDICHALSQICRFTGHTREFYSVAQHSVAVADLVADDAEAVSYALIHDAHEAFVNDLATPLKQAMREETHEGAQSYNRIRDRFDAAIHQAAGLQYPVPDHIARKVKRADNIMLVSESRDLMYTPVFLAGCVDTGVKKITPLTPYEARHLLANRLQIALPALAIKGAAA